MSSQYSVVKSSREKSTIAVFKPEKNTLVLIIEKKNQKNFIKFEMKYEYFYELLSSY